MTANESVNNEFNQYEPMTELVRVSRTAKVVKGGQNMSFSALVVAGDGKSKVGYGLGKAKEVSGAIRKATDIALKSMRHVHLNGTTLQYPHEERFGATRVYMRPATEGTGIIAGGAMRAVFKVLGVQNVLAKIIGSTNHVNVVIATINGLTGMSDPKDVARKRSMSVKKMFNIESDAKGGKEDGK